MGDIDMYISEKYINEHVYTEGVITKVVNWYKKITGQLIFNDESNLEKKRDQEKYDKFTREYEKCTVRTPPRDAPLCIDIYLRKIRKVLSSTKICSKMSDTRSKVKCQANINSNVHHLDLAIEANKLKVDKIKARTKK